MQISRQQSRPRAGAAGAATRARPQRVALRCYAVNKEQIKQCYAELLEFVNSKSCNPIIVRLAWHDAGTYDASVKEWPARGGANASIRFTPESGHGANAGLKIAMGLLKPFEKKYPEVSVADLYQMASAAAIEAAGGPKIPMQYGRKDVMGSEGCAVDGRLPAAAKPFPDGSVTPAQHLRKVFYRMGLNDQEIVALSGGHTLGRSRPDRSGHGVASTKYTEKGPGTPGGQSWTADWLTFNNSYFTAIKEQRDADLLVLPTDAAIFDDEAFRPFAEKYAADEAAFFADYSVAHKKLSELGVEWEAGAPVTI